MHDSSVCSRRWVDNNCRSDTKAAAIAYPHRDSLRRHSHERSIADPSNALKNTITTGNHIYNNCLKVHTRDLSKKSIT